MSTEVNTGTKLDLLNKRLKQDKSLPSFRQHVERSGSNLDFLRKKYRGNDDQIKQLVQLSIQQLLEPLEVSALETVQ